MSPADKKTPEVFPRRAQARPCPNRPEFARLFEAPSSLAVDSQSRTGADERSSAIASTFSRWTTCRALVQWYSIAFLLRLQFGGPGTAGRWPRSGACASPICRQLDQSGPLGGRLRR